MRFLFSGTACPVFLLYLFRICLGNEQSRERRFALFLSLLWKSQKIVMKIDDIRKEYKKGRLLQCAVAPGPEPLFEQWLEEAVGAGITEPTAMVLATVSEEGYPSARTVLLKEFKDGKFIFFTNYESRKGIQLAHNAHVAITFPWYQQERQVQVEGVAVKLSETESEAYFNSRPYESRIAAVVSSQSRPIKSRRELLKKFAEAKIRYRESVPEKPIYWGGYAVTPVLVEFWQGGEHRLHDRILYTLQPDGKWKRERLAP